MKNELLFLLVFTSVLLLSCKVDNSKSIAYANLYEQDGNQLNKIVLIDSIAYQVDTVKLEGVLGNATGLLSTDKGYYFILNGTEINHFDSSGNFICKVGANGRGPGEYLYPKSMRYINDSLLYVFDFSSQKLLRYNPNGEYLGFIDLSGDTYLDDFFYNNGALYFNSIGNSKQMDLFMLNQPNNDLKQVLHSERIAAEDEVLMGKVLTFGSNYNPYIYNTFNDTVFKLDNSALVPQFLLKQGNLRFNFNELTMDKLMSIDKQRIQVRNIVCSGKYVFISYIIISNNDRKSYLGLFNLDTNEYDQDVKILSTTGADIINSSTNLYNTFNDGELIKIDDDGDELLLIKYKLK